MSSPALELKECGAPNCHDRHQQTCGRCARPLCAWHYVTAGDGHGGLEPVCFPTCGAEFWKVGADVREARPGVVSR